MIKKLFAKIMKKMKADKPKIMKRQMDLLKERYDLSDKPAEGLTMSRGKPVQKGVRVKLPKGMTWDKLASMTPEEIHEKGLFPKGFMPLPHPNFNIIQGLELAEQEKKDLVAFLRTL